jgi:hypothetical protein
MASATERFLEAVHRAPTLWQSVDLRIVAVYAEGSWRNLVSRCYLRPNRDGAIRRLRYLPETPYLRAWQVVRPRDALETLLREQQGGALKLGEETVLFVRAASGTTPETPYDFGGFTELLGDVPYYRSLQWPGYILTGTGDSSTGLLQRTPGEYSGIEAMIRGLKRPFRSINELGTYVCGPGWAGTGYSSSAEWYAPLEARLETESTDYRSGVVRYRVIGGSRRALQSTKLFIHVQAGLGGEVTPQLGPKAQLPVASLRLSTQGDTVVARGERVVKGASEITLTLRVGEESVQWLDLKDYRAGNANARLTLYETVDPGARILRGWLRSETKPDRTKLALAVGRLFLLCGFEADVLTTDKRLEEGVDVLAHDVAGARCLAIECTTGSINAAGKIGKLGKRVSELQRSAPGIRVRGVIVASTPVRDLSETELRDAGEDELCVIAAEGVQELFQMAERSASVSEVIQYIEQSRPTRERDDNLSWLSR